MRKTNNIILNIVLCLGMALVCASCLTEKEGPLALKQNVMIELSVSVGNMTKAPVYEDATSAEKVINNLRVYAFRGEKLIGYVAREATALNDPFFMDLELPETGVYPVDFYLVANEKSMGYENALVELSENMTRNQLESIRFTSLAGGTALPMYCRHLSENIDVDNIKAIANDATGHAGHIVLNHSITFMLERSLAKLSFYAAKSTGSTSNPQIHKVNLLASGTRHFSYLFPQAESVLTSVAHRANDRSLLSVPVTITQEITSGSSDVGNSDKYNTVVSGVYIPEVVEGIDVMDAAYQWNVSSGDTRAAVLHVQYTLGEGYPYKYAYIYLPKIQRNTHNKICVLINAEGQIIINYTVGDWDVHSMPSLIFDYPTHSYIRENIPVTEADLTAVPSGPAIMAETVPFQGYFQMTYPSSDKWKPTLRGLNASSCTIKVFDCSVTPAQEVIDSHWPIGASEKWYMIQVTPKPGYMSINEEVELAITYQASGMATHEFLLVNGSYGQYYWPYTGASQQDDSYVLITMVK